MRPRAPASASRPRPARGAGRAGRSGRRPSVGFVDPGDVDPPAGREARLLAWLASRSVPAHDLEIATFPGAFPGSRYRGLRTKRAVKGGELLLRIPRALLMSQKTARETGPEAVRSLLVALERDGALPGKVMVALHLLHEYFDPASEWAPWLRTLPSQEGSLLLFDASEIEEMQCTADGCPILGKARAVRAEIERLHAALRPAMERVGLVPDGRFTLDNFLWAYLTVVSRAFSIEATERYGHGIVGGGGGARG